MKLKKYSIRTFIVIIGSIISAYGITLAINAGFGSATLAILWQGLSKVTGLSIGTSSLVIAVENIFIKFFILSILSYNIDTNSQEFDLWV